MRRKNDQDDISALVYAINHIHPLGDDIVAYLQANCFFTTCKRGKHLLKTGEICRTLYFIRTGALRGYIKENTRDITTWISIDNELVTSISSFDLQVTAIENIQALEDCDLIGISYNNLQKLYLKFPEYNIVARKVYQSYYRDAENRALIARLTNAENKYLYFLRMHSHLANRVPLKYIASFLGITLETLSRVRKKLSISDAG
ncbi:Crp/Fnr family transcriptional regulator [Ferruginibacter lapsinanis]|uniref:Crp/Fnr family transcriptional regulator n=1 Tax=Ferruginibacter lapsinanis TaxID=563172 RepID=UPI001E4AE69F|nr:Crp/Fnr family transcriptional regulator [Ferruginibacter lapsinanis]UEG48489.1 Crp/Fnr family transcriptional regulator [Ferruginibacter lapsinanis]